MGFISMLYNGKILSYLSKYGFEYKNRCESYFFSNGCYELIYVEGDAKINVIVNESGETARIEYRNFPNADYYNITINKNECDITKEKSFIPWLDNAVTMWLLKKGHDFTFMNHNNIIRK